MNDPTNTDRAMWAQAAVTTFAEITRMDSAGEDDETIMADLLADLMHLAESKDIDWAATLERATGHYEYEKEHDEP